jgi:hypothetical protein
MHFYIETPKKWVYFKQHWGAPARDRECGWWSEAAHFVAESMDNLSSIKFLS